MDSRDLGIRQVEAYTGVSRSTISQILQGHNLPSNTTVIKLARYFGEAPDRLLAMVVREKTGETLEAGRPSEDDIDLEDPALNLQLKLAAKELSAEGRRSLLDYVRFVLEQERRERERKDKSK